MQQTVISFRSYTDAMKARSLLSSEKLHSVYGKITDTGKGCLHTLSVSADSENIIRLLKGKVTEFRILSGGMKP